MFHELVALAHVMVAVDVPFRFASVVAKLMVELAVMVFPAIGRIVVVGVWRSTNPEDGCVVSDVSDLVHDSTVEREWCGLVCITRRSQ